MGTALNHKAKIALITGITGQDGAYLAELLLGKDYIVHGILRRSSLDNTDRIAHLLHPRLRESRLTLHHGDLGDTSSLIRIIGQVQPDEIYNLGAMSDVAVSFDIPEYTADINALGTLRILEAIRILGLERKTRFYQASTSELFGLAQEIPQKETTPFYPRSPYAAAKLYAYWITVHYREAYGIYACNGILFNHESPRRGEAFVSRRITRGLARIALGLQNSLTLGYLDARRDWGHARDYTYMQWLMLQQERAEDFVIATGVQHSVREFVEMAARELDITIAWQGNGVNEIGIVTKASKDHASALRPGQTIITIDPGLYRPAEVPALLGDINKARSKLGWKPSISLSKIASEMVQHDLKDYQSNSPTFSLAST